jgi:RimJ/RimL family protein N-acetyltransferase
MPEERRRTERASSPVRVDGGRVVLRAFDAADLPTLRAAFVDPEASQWNGGVPLDPDAVEQWLARRNDWSDGTHASWAISDPAGGLLGSISLHRIDLDQGDAETGYWLAPAARGRGNATAALRLASGYGFETLGLRRIVLYHAVINPASCRVAAAAGFLLEGTLRQSHRYADGRVHDEHVHGRLRTDPAP